jgi:Bax protein|tara:strand:+ start:29 stop:691 length:663 start_codon:yes stop_codon:yes gene_type:complete
MIRPEPRKQPSIIKWVVATIVLVTIIIGGSFTGGTFYPNVWTVKKIEAEVHKKELSQVQLLGLKEPEFEYSDKATFLTATGKCVEYLNYTTDRLSRVPTSIIIAMAGVESGWGTSRFANEGNALFGVRTWDKNTPRMKAKGNPDANWGVKKYKTKCQSVKDMIAILNRHPAYKEFRVEREQQLDDGKWNYRKLMVLMNAWSTNPDYHEIILQAIVDNKLP